MTAPARTLLRSPLSGLTTSTTSSLLRVPATRSPLARTPHPHYSPTHPAAALPAIRSLHGSSTRSALKESDRNRENLDAEDVGKARDEHLRNHKDGKGQWNESLASDSEASVKADRDYFPHSKEVEEAKTTLKNKHVVKEKGWKKEEIVEKVPKEE